MKSSEHPHPRPGRYRLEQRLLMVLLLAVVLGAVGQVVLALLFESLLFALGAVTILAFAPFLLMSLSVTPPVSIMPEGLRITPHWWPPHTIPWDRVAEVRSYPLLPRPDQETERRALRGRKRYRAAEGIMLVVPGLPWQYRAAGFFAGAGGQPIIALTNRTHTHYDALVKAVQAAVPGVQEG